MGRSLRGASFKESEDVLPTRNDFAAVYRVLRATFCDSVREMGKKQLLSMARSAPSVKMNHIKLRIILDVLDEMNLCKVIHREFDLIEFDVNLSAAKVDLESSPLLCRLRRQCG